MKTIETTVFEFSELEDDAKEKARQWYRGGPDFFFNDYMIDNFVEVCEMMGIEVDTHSVPLMNGTTRQAPDVFWSGFSSQGDGASFAGSYNHQKGSAAAIRSEYPTDTDLHEIADDLRGIQKRNFFQLSARISCSGSYSNEMSMTAKVERDSPTYQDETEDAEEVIQDAMRSLAQWLYSNMEREFDYQYSDEQVDESINANEYTFTEEGERFG